MALSPEKAERIAGMLVRRYSLDLISVWGLQYGWTRADVLGVVKDRHWALDWEGRLQPRFIARAAAAVCPQPAVPIADADHERLLLAGMDHRLVEIRRVAARAQRSMDELRRALILQEEKDLEEALRQRAERLAAACSDPLGGSLTHCDAPSAPQDGPGDKITLSQVS